VLDNDGRSLYSQCYSHPELDHVITTQTPDRYFAEFAQFPARATINGDLVLRAEKSMNIVANPGFLENMYRVELQVVRQSQC